MSDLTFKSLIHFELIFVWYKIRVQFHSFACEYPVFPTLFVEGICFSHCVFWDPCQISVDCICMSLFLGFLFSSVGCVSVFMPVPSHFDYNRFIISFEISKCEASIFVLIQDNFVCLGFFTIPYEF